MGKPEKKYIICSRGDDGEYDVDILNTLEEVKDKIEKYELECGDANDNVKLFFGIEVDFTIKIKTEINIEIDEDR